MGRVKQAATTAARRRRKRVILRAEAQENAMVISLRRRQGLLHSSSSSFRSEQACFNEERALNPPRFARFGAFFDQFFAPKKKKIAIFFFFPFPNGNAHRGFRPSKNRFRLWLLCFCFLSSLLPIIVRMCLFAWK